MMNYALRSITLGLTILAAAHASAVTVVKQTNMNQDAAESPWFWTSPDGLTPFLASKHSPAGTGPLSGQVIEFRPLTPVQAGTVSTITTTGNFQFTGNATAANNFTDGNQIPTGIVITFNTTTTFSVGAGAPANSVFTAAGQSGAAFGNGLGIVVQASPNPLGFIDSPSETLEVSDTVVSNVSVTGTVPGYTFTFNNVGNFGPYAL